MNQIFLKKLSIVFLLFVIVGALFMCVFTVAMPMGNGMHNMPINNEMLVMHSLHLKELTTATIAKVSFNFIFTAMVFLFVFTFLYKFTSFLKLILLGYLRKKFYDIFHIVQITFSQWLSLFEGSPNFS